MRQTLDAEIEARRRADRLVAGLIDERRNLMQQLESDRNIAVGVTNTDGVARIAAAIHIANDDRAAIGRGGRDPTGAGRGNFWTCVHHNRLAVLVLVVVAIIVQVVGKRC